MLEINTRLQKKRKLTKVSTTLDNIIIFFLIIIRIMFLTQAVSEHFPQTLASTTVVSQIT